MPTNTTNPTFSVKLAQAEDQLAAKTAEAAKLRDSVEFLFGLLEKAKAERDVQLSEIKALNTSLREKDTIIGDLQQQRQLQEAAFRKLLEMERQIFEKRLTNQKKLIQDRESLLCLWVEGAIKSTKEGDAMDPLITHLVEKTSSNVEISRQSAIEAFKFTSKASSMPPEDKEADSKAFLVRLKKLKFSKFLVSKSDGKMLKKKGPKRGGNGKSGGNDDESDGNEDDDHDDVREKNGKKHESDDHKTHASDKDNKSLFAKTQSMFSTFVSPKPQRKPSNATKVAHATATTTTTTNTHPNKKNLTVSTHDANAHDAANQNNDRVILRYETANTNAKTHANTTTTRPATNPTTPTSPKVKSLLSSFMPGGGKE